MSEESWHEARLIPSSGGLVQARALGTGLPDIAAMRAVVRRTHEVRRFEPRAGLDCDGAAELRVVGAAK